MLVRLHASVNVQLQHVCLAPQNLGHTPGALVASANGLAATATV